MVTVTGPRHPKSSKYMVNGCLEPLKAEPQEMFRGSDTYSQGIWMSRVGGGHTTHHVFVGSPKVRALEMFVGPKTEDSIFPERGGKHSLSP